MTKPIHVLGFSGSLRRDSYNRALLQFGYELMPEGMTLEIFDLSAIPLYNPDVEQEGFPESVERFRQRIARADAVLIATPEYNHSIPGVLKNALDWASRPPDIPVWGKPAAIIGVSTGLFGTVRAQSHLRQILTALNMPTVSKPEVMVPLAREKFDSSGCLTDENSIRFYRELLLALANLVRRQRLELAAAER